jgi:hypothetical protein
MATVPEELSRSLQDVVEGGRRARSLARSHRTQWCAGEENGVAGG